MLPGERLGTHTRCQTKNYLIASTLTKAESVLQSSVVINEERKKMKKKIGKETVNPIIQSNVGLKQKQNRIPSMSNFAQA